MAKKKTLMTWDELSPQVSEMSKIISPQIAKREFFDIYSNIQRTKRKNQYSKEEASFIEDYEKQLQYEEQLEKQEEYLKLEEDTKTFDSTQKEILGQLYEEDETKALDYIKKTKRLNEIKLADKNLQELEKASNRADKAKGFWNGENWIANLDYAKQSIDKFFSYTGNTNKDEDDYNRLAKEVRQYESPIVKKMYEEERKKYKYLDKQFQDKQDVLLGRKPEKIYNEVTGKYDEVMTIGPVGGSIFGEWELNDPEYLKLKQAKKLKDTRMNAYEDYLKAGDGQVSDFIEGIKAPEYKKIFGQDLFDAMRIYQLNGKDEKDLSVSDKELLKQISDNQNFSQVSELMNKGRYGYRWGDGVGESGIFMAQFLLASKATAPISGAVRAATTKLLPNISSRIIANTMNTVFKAEQSALLNGINITERGLLNAAYKSTKALPAITDAVVSPLAMTSTYAKGAEKTLGLVTVVKDKEGEDRFLFTKPGKIAYEKQIQNEIKIKENQLKTLKETSKDEEKIKEKENEIQVAKDSLRLIYDPEKEGQNVIPEDVSIFDAIMYGYTENLKESVAEKYVGQLGSKLSKPIGKLINKTPFLGKNVFKPLGNISNNLWKQGENFINKTAFGKLSQNALYHTGTAQMWHGLPGEVLEEIAVQMTPSYMNSWEQNWNQMKELGNPQFYMDVVAQTLIMGGAFTGINQVQHGVNYLTSSKYRENIKQNRDLTKELKEVYKGIDNSINDDELANHILMNTGGTLFEVQDYQAKIADLRNKGQKDLANKLEQKSFMNIASKALKTNTIDKFEESLKNIQSNSDLSPETKINATLALSKLDDFRNIQFEHSNKVNYSKIMDLSFNKLYNRDTLKELDKKIEDLKLSTIEDVEQFKRQNNINPDFTLQGITDKIDDKVSEEGIAYNKFIADLHRENIPGVNDMLNLIVTRDMYENFDYENNKKLRYELAPENQEKINKEYQEKINKLKVENVTSETAQDTKEDINKNGIIDKKVNNNIDKKVDEQNKTNPISTTEVETKIENNINEGDLLVREGIKPTNEVLEDGDKMADDSKPITEQDQLLNLDTLYSPMVADENNPVHVKKIEGLSKSIRTTLDKYPTVTFSGLISNMMGNFNHDTVEHSFDLISKAWEKATGKKLEEQEKQDAYTSRFGDFEINSEDLLTNSNTPLNPGNIETQQSTQADIKISEEVVAPEITVGVNPLTKQVEVMFRGYKINEPSIKVAMLGLNYKLSDDGLSYETITNTVNESAFPVLNWNNFKPGDKVNLSFKFDYLESPDNPMRIWLNNNTDNPIAKNSNVKEVIESIFGKDSYNSVIKKLRTDDGKRELLSNEDFLKIIPTGFNINGEQIEAGINDYHWWNARNVALPIDKLTGKPLVERRNSIIQQAKEFNLATRKQMVANNLSVDLEVEERKEGFQNKQLLKTPEEKKQGHSNQFQSLESAFSGDIDAVKNNIGFAIIGKNNALQSERKGDKPIIKVGNKQIYPNQIVNYNASIESMSRTSITFEGNTYFIENNGDLTNRKGSVVSNSKEILDKGIKTYNSPSGKQVIIKQIGIDKYSMHRVLNNHETQQERFKIGNDIFDQLLKYKEILLNEKIGSPTQREKAIKIEKFFIDNYGFRISDDTYLTKFKFFYPQKVMTKTGYTIKQDYNVDMSNNNASNNIPDILDFTSVAEFEQAVLQGTISSTTYKDILAKNLHTPFIFTNIGTNENPMWTSEAQPVISFNNNHLSEQKIKEIEKSVGVDKRTDDEKLQTEVNAVKKSIELLQKGIEQETDKKRLSNLENKLEQEKAKLNELNKVKPSVTEILNKAVEDIKEELNSEKEFDDNDIVDINNELLYRTLAKIDPTKEFTKQDLIQELSNTFEEITKELKNKGLNQELDFINEKRNEILGIDSYDGSVRETLDTILNLQEDEDFDFSSVFIKDNNKESFENDITTSLSDKVKILFAGIKDTRNTEKGFAGFEQYMPFSQSIDALQQILSESNNNTLEEIRQRIKDKVKKNPSEFGFYKEMLGRLNKMNNQNPAIINEILYFLYQPKVEMAFIMYKANQDGTYSLQRYNADSKNPNIIKKQKWNEMQKNSPLIEKFEEGFYRINKNYADEVTNLYNQLQEQKKTGNIDINIVKDYLNYFGIKLTPGTLKSLKDNLFNDANTSLFTINEETKEQFGILANNQIVDLLYKNLTTALKLQEEGKILSFNDRYVDNKKLQTSLNLLTSDTTGALKTLIEADNEMSFTAMSSMYIAGKTINHYQQPKRINNILKKLKFDTKYLDKVKQTEITSESFIVEMLNSNPELKNYMDVVNISLEALKQMGSESRDDMSITNLSDKDAFVTLFNMFAHNDGKILNDDYSEKDIELRKGTISFPTLSDSSQLPLFKTVMIDLQKSHFNQDMTLLNDNILSLMIDKMIKGDLKRISSFLKSGGVNIKGHNAGAGFITSMASMNTLMVETENTRGEIIKRPLIEVFKHYGPQDLPYRDNIDNFLEDYKEDIQKEMQRNIDYEVGKFITNDGKSGSMVSNEIFVGNSLKFIDEQYLKNKKGVTGINQARLIAYDYVLNNFIQQREIQNLFAGDVANYFKDKMGKNLDFGLPSVDINDIINYYYPTMLEDDRKSINENIDKPGFIDSIKEYYPKLLAAKSISTIPLEERIEIISPIANIKVIEMFKDVQNNLSKRLKSLVSPGSQFPNSNGNQKYYQVMLKDVESASEDLEYKFAILYPGQSNEEVKKLVEEFKVIDNIYENERNDEQNEKYNNLLNKFQKDFPLIFGYFKTASTDAQEYNTWKDNLNQLKAQGRITSNEFKQIYDKLSKQDKDIKENGTISEHNKWQDSEKELRKKAAMQPTKPLYSGLHMEEVNGYNLSRDIYIKSSSFPLLPELTVMFPKLESLRRNLENLEQYDNEGNPVITVRASYDSANKDGAVKNALSINELYKDNPNMDLLSQATIELDRGNFFIQQDKPLTPEEEANRNNRATQFEKILLGDGISKIIDHIFPNMFDNQLLNEFGIKDKDGMLDGPSLKKLYDGIYEKEQKLLTNKLFRKFGISNYNDINNGKPEIMEKIVDLLKERLNNKQDKEALELVYTVVKDDRELPMSKKEVTEGGHTPTKATFKIPLYMMPNSKKFESVLNSVINKNNINLKLLGFSSPVASQEGFDFKGYEGKSTLDNLKKQGLITTKNFDPNKGLQATRREDGSLKYAQVFISNKYKVFDKKTNQYKYIDLKQFVDENGQIDTDKLPQELLSMFSFRIPTSSHQSGVVIEVAGFLPSTSASLMIVPKDHTVQIGEDYDIDMRYVYQYHYIQTEDGKLKKLEYSDLPENIGKSYDEIKQEFENDKKELFDNFFKISVDTNKPLELQKSLKNPLWNNNREKLLEIAILQESLDNYHIDKLLNSIFDEQWEFDREITREDISNRIAILKSQIIPTNLVKEKGKELNMEYKEILNSLKDEFKNNSKLANSYDRYKNSLQEQKDHQMILENNLVSLYKSVFTSDNQQIQSLINKVLSTDNAENTAKMMDDKIQSSEKSDMYNIYSPTTQREILKLGADGKIGIGEHSNAVTMNSLFQQSEQQHRIVQFYKEREDGDMHPVFYNIQLGKLIFDGKMGKIDENNVRISELGMESQNSATDNQKLQIMGRRNENPNTMAVLKILQANGIDNDKIKVNGKTVSYSSLFLNQPILRRYTELMNKFNSSTDNTFGSNDKLIEEQLLKEFGSSLGKYWKTDKKGDLIPGKLKDDIKIDVGSNLTSEKLWNNLLSEDTQLLDQWYIYESFKQLQGAAKKYNELQQFINIEKGGMGVSYFDTIDLMNKLENIITNPEPNITNQKLMFGDSTFIYNNGTDSFNRTSEDLIKEGYIQIKTDENGKTLYIKPSNHYAHKIVNAITLGYNMYNNFFPYDHKYIKEQIDEILNATNIKEDTKQALELKYKIISSLKDYVYSNNRTLFENNINKSVNELMFDNNENNNQSLTSYLMSLQQNEKYSKLFNNPFFKDLQFDINEGNYPSLIKFNNSDISKINSLDIHNMFNKMIDSKKELPTFNGKSYNYEMLMKDLLKYSLIADQANGAIGFRHLLPIKLFDKYNVSNTVRSNTDVNNQSIQNLVYNGLYKSLESLLGNRINENGTIVNKNNMSVKEIRPIVAIVNRTLKDQYNKDNTVSIDDNGNININDYNGEKFHSAFVKQFIQHNAKNVKNVGKFYRKVNEYTGYPENIPNKSLKDILTKNKIDKSNIDKITSFYYVSDLPFVQIENENGKIMLFERKSNNYFERVPVLGVFGFNEYQAGKTIEKSKVAKNNFNTDFNNSRIVPSNTTKYINETSLNDILNNIKEDYNGPYSSLVDMLLPMVNIDNVTIETKIGLQGNAQYSNEKIFISQEFIDKEPTKSEIQSVIIEEFVHHSTKKAFDKYVTFTNIDKEGRITYTINKDELGNELVLPAQLQTLISVYQQAFKHIAKKQGLDSLLSKINRNNNQLLSPNDLENELDAYRVSNIHEFIAGIFLKDESFAKEMSNTQYLNSDKTILEKYADTLIRFFNRILPNKRTDTISAQVVQELYSFLKEHNEVKEKVSEVKSPINQESNNVLSKGLDLLNEDILSREPNVLLAEIEYDNIYNTEITNYQNLTDEPMEDYIASEKTIRDLAAKLSDRIGIPIKFESDRSKDYKGKIEDSVAYINLAHATLDTPIHEILGHPIIRALKNNNFTMQYDENGKYIKNNTNQLYQNLLKELETGKGKEVLDRIKRDYVEKHNLIDNYITPEGYTYIIKNNRVYNKNTNDIVFNSLENYADFLNKQEETNKFKVSKYSLEEQQEEAIVELLGLMTAEKLDNVKDGKLISLLKRLLKEMKQFVRSLLNQREVEIDKLPDNMTINDLSDLLAYSNSKLILPGYEVEYTTPDNEKFKTYQEASNHISELARNVEDVNLDKNISVDNIDKEIEILQKELDNFKFEIEPFNKFTDVYTKKGRLRQNYWARKKDGTTGWTGGSKETLIEPEYDGFVLDTDRGDGRFITKISDKEAEELYYAEENKFNTTTKASREKYAELETKIHNLKNNSLKGFIEKNKEYEQSKEIIEEWKKVNNIQYNPEEIYSRGQEFSSVVGAYSDFDVNLMMQNLLSHIEDNEKAGGKFAISAYTKPIDRQIGHLEGGGGKIKFKLYPQSNDILWAANTDVYSGSVWDASEKVNKDKESELLGVSYTKYPSLSNVNTVQPNLATIVDDLAHHHNELGITLTGNNFRLEYDEDIPYSTKKIINSINSILDQKYGKLVKPEINKKVGNKVEYIFGNDTFNTLEEAKKAVDLIADTEANEVLGFDYSDIKKRVIPQGVQPTQTNETLKESIDSIEDKITKFSNIEKYQKEYDDFSSKKENILRFRPENYDSSFDQEYYAESLEQAKTKDWWVEDYFKVKNVTEELNSFRNKKAVKLKEDLDRYKKEYKELTGKDYKLEYTEQALTNTKVAVLKEVSKKYPRSLIRSEVKPIDYYNNITYAPTPDLFDVDELPFQKISNKEQKPFVIEQSLKKLTTFVDVKEKC